MLNEVKAATGAATAALSTRIRLAIARDPDPGQVLIRHQANFPSGGHVTDIEVGGSSSQGKGPEQQELLRLIGTLVDKTADTKKPALVGQNGGRVKVRSQSSSG